MITRLLRFRKPKRYVLYLARRGRPLVIEEIEARNISEAAELAEAIIESLSPEEIPDLQKYRYFIIEREDRKERKKIRNPFQTPEKEAKSLEEVAAEITLTAVMERLPLIVEKGLDLGFRVQEKVIEHVVDMNINMMRKMMGVKSDREEMAEAVKQLAGVIAAGLAQQATKQSSTEGAQSPPARPRVIPKERTG